MTELHLIKDKEGPPALSELSRALAPLHREYLRRLNEMAGRVTPSVLLREATTRDDNTGLLITGEDGFPLVFDVADQDTGSTFEVRSAHEDEPVVKLVRIGALEVELKAGCWESLTVDCRFAGNPVAEDAVALASILRAFIELGHVGAYAARGSAEPWSGRIHSMSVHVSGSSVAALFDLGSCPPSALDMLMRALDGFGHNRAPLAKVIIGGPPPDPARTL